MQTVLINVVITVITNILVKMLTEAGHSTTFMELKRRVKESEGKLDDCLLVILECVLGAVEADGPQIAQEFRSEMEKLKR